MKLKPNSFTVTLSALLLTLAVSACNSQPAPTAAAPRTAPSSSRSNADLARATTAEGQPYDFYILNLSWSPEYCVTNPAALECQQHLGFVLHGLWPQNNDGSYPKNCPQRPGPTGTAWQGLFPAASLAAHEWKTHGVCTPYDADTYFNLIRNALAAVKIPPTFTGTSQPPTDTPADIISQFAQINPGIPTGGIALSCGNNHLTAIEVCMDKNLSPIACREVRSCRATTIKITPR